MTDEQVIRVSGQTYTIIAYCQDPRRAWVMPGRHRGLTDGQAFVIDVSRANFLTPQLPWGSAENLA